MDLFESKNIAPMLIADEKPAFDSPDWIYELKLDGIRCVVYLDKTEAVLRNKRNKDVTGIYPELSLIHKQAKKRCILDGELFALKDGKPDFYEMQRRSLMTNKFKIELAAKKLPLSFVAFDILYLGNKPLTDRPLMERKGLLQKAITESERMAVSRYVEQEGIALYEAAEKSGLEGIVAKRKDSLYYFGKQTKNWIKCKALLDEDFVVCGYYPKADNYVSIILGRYADAGLVYRSHVVMSVSRGDYKYIAAAKRTDRKEHYITFPVFDDAIWLAPVLVCTVRFMEYTPGGGLRQPAFKGLRDDKLPKECTIKSDD